jgi:Ca-activated chloride channel homolog
MAGCVLTVAFAILLMASTDVSARKPEKQTKKIKLIASALASVPQQKEGQVLAPYFFVGKKDTGIDNLPLKNSFATVDIAGLIANVTVEQSYENTSDTTLEAVYIFPASTRAALHGMQMTVGNRVIKAKIKRRKQARKIYEKARSLGQTASLLEQERPNVFQMSVANILPGDRINVKISYTELLHPSEGLYEFVYPQTVGPRYLGGSAQANDSWAVNPHLRQGEPAPFDSSIDLRIVSGIPIERVTSPTHEVEAQFFGEYEAQISLDTGAHADRDFIVRYSLSGSQIESGIMDYPTEDGGFFCAMIEPPSISDSRAILRREYIFILDVSGSMNGFPLEVSKRLIKDILADLDSDDAFNILLFAGGSEVFEELSQPATAENLNKAMKWIDGQHGGGSTELLPALRRALNLPREDDLSRILVLATDGYVSVEKEAIDIVSQNLGLANLFAFGIGSSVNRALIEGLAHVGRGETFVVLNPKEAQERAADFRKYVSSPLLRHIEVEFEGLDVYDVEPFQVPDLFMNRPIVVYGKYRGKPTGVVRVVGETIDGPYEATMELASAIRSEATRALPILWARHRIRNLADLQKIDGNSDVAKEVTRLGLKYHLMTDYTSFVAVDSVIRSDGRMRKVKQPLPLPLGVSDLAVGRNAANAHGTLMGGQMGKSFGYGGLGLAGTGRGGGGSGSGYGRGASGLAGRRGNSAPRIRMGKAVVKGSLSKEVILRIIKRHMNEFRLCYEKVLAHNSALKGKIDVKFSINAKGKVLGATVTSSSLNNQVVERCVVSALGRMSFPGSNDGRVNVVRYSFRFGN